MENQKSPLIKFYLFFFLLIVFLPIFQFTFKPFKVRGLEGAFILNVMPKLTISSWVNTNFQDSTSTYLTHNTPFRGELVRLRNQLDYSLFDKINTILTLGKENYLFDPSYIKSRSGDDLLLPEVLAQKIEKIRKAKTVLDKLNVPILFCFAPNKANYYPEFLPKETPLALIRNQTIIEKELTNLGISTLNFDAIFRKEKPSSSYSLIPKYGAHWSTFGAFLASRKLFQSIDSITNKKHIEINLVALETKGKAKFSDCDYLASLNLLKRWKSPSLAYPEVSFNVINKPNLLIISDSFFWNFYDLNIPQNTFSLESEMWYYNKSKYNINKEKIGECEILSIDDLKNRDVIIILSADPSLLDVGFGIFEQISNLNGH